MPRITKKRMERLNSINDYIEQKLGEHNWEVGDGLNFSSRDVPLPDVFVSTSLLFHKDFFPIGGTYDIFTLAINIFYDVRGDSYDTNLFFSLFRNVEGVKRQFSVGNKRIDSLGLSNFCSDILATIFNYERNVCNGLMLEPCKKEQKQ